jgi:plasmid stabilization system protein ParE
LTIVFYKVDQNEMIILRAIDGRMDLESVFREQPK